MSRTTPPKRQIHPILGTAPQWENVILATGHNSAGIILSAITGKTIVEAILINQVSQIIKSFILERFKF